MALFVLTKPDIIYNYNIKKYKEFGNTGDKTYFTLPVIAIISALLIGILFTCANKKTNEIFKYQKNLNELKIQLLQQMIDNNLKI